MKIWDKLVNEKELDNTVKNLELHGINVVVVNNKEEALKEVIKLIPKGAEVFYGSSKTLIEIGFNNYLEKEDHGWKNLGVEIWSEKNEDKRSDLRRKATAAEYFLGSVNAVSETGELVTCDASGSRVGAYLFSAKHLVLIAGTQKIVPTLNDAMKRIREYVFPLEDQRAKLAYGVNSSISKWAIIEKESIKDRITLILVKEKLGF